MVAPVTGPFTVYPSSGYSDRYRMWYRQKKPYDRPLTFEYRDYFGKQTYTSFNGFNWSTTVSKNANLSWESHPDASRREAHAFNRAYDKLRGSLGDQAGWAENIAQINKTRKGFVDRSVQLARFVGHLRRCDFVRAAKVLRTPIPSRVSNRKAVAQNFLEWEYGVKPLISDIQASAQELVRSEYAGIAIEGRASETWSRVTVTRSSGSYGSSSYNRDMSAGKCSITCRAIATINNPNLFLANQLGVIDLALPWKLVPFSFVVDWFVNVEQVISATTDWYGVTLTHPHVTRFYKGYGSIEQASHTYGLDSKGVAKLASASIVSWPRTFTRVKRELGIPKPTLVVKPFKGFSVNRGAQAIALVVAVLGR